MDVTVVMAVWNEKVYLRETLNSILAQKGLNFEIVVVDDGSTDITPQILREYTITNPNIRVFTNLSKGKVSAFNFGVSQAKGKYVCLFAGDDIMPEGSLADRFGFIESVADDGPSTGLYKIRTLSEDKKFDGHIVPKAKGKGNPSGQSPLMNKAMIDLFFPVPESLPNEDTWLEIGFKHLNKVSVFHSDIVCCNWRIHEGNSYNMTLGFKKYKDRLLSRWRAYDLFMERYDNLLSADSKEIVASHIKCNDYYERGNFMGIFISKIDFVQKLRMLSTINLLFFTLRRRFYGLFSGW